MGRRGLLRSLPSGARREDGGGFGRGRDGRLRRRPCILLLRRGRLGRSSTPLGGTAARRAGGDVTATVVYWKNILNRIHFF